MAPLTSLEPWIKSKIGSAGGGPDLRKEIDLYQLKKLRETVEYARSNAPFYRSLLRGLRGDDISSLEDLSSLPFTTPDDLKEDDLRFICVSRDEISRVVTINTSGTTGEAKRIHFTESDLELTTDLFHHGMKNLVRSGDTVMILMPGDRHGTVGNLMVKALKRMDALGVPHGIVFDSGQTIREIVRTKADSIIGIPVQVLGLVRHEKAAEIPPGTIKSVLLSADYVPAAIVREIEAAWECPVFNHYGMTEMGLGAAVDCKALCGYHIREADLLFEIVDPDSGRPVPDGTTGEVVFTTLTRRGMPLVRYRTGDISRFIPEPCPCGTVLKRLEWVKGRLRGGVDLGGDALLTVADLDEALFPLPGLLNFRVEISGNSRNTVMGLTMYIGDADAAALGKAAATALREIRPVRAALDGGVLTIDPVRTSSENWLSTGSIKRKIIDSRQEERLYA